MTEKLKQAARQALEALEVSTDWDVGARGKQLQSMKAITALREALAEPKRYNHETGSVLIPNPLAEQAEQEPVASIHLKDGCIVGSHKKEGCELADGEYMLVARNTAPQPVGQEPVAYMFKVKRTLPSSVPLDVFAAIEYHPLPHEDIVSKEPLYTTPQPVKEVELTDIEDLQDAVTKAMKKAFQLGQTYWQQADSESYAANKRADVTQALYWKLEDDTRAVIAADREKNK